MRKGFVGVLCCCAALAGACRGGDDLAAPPPATPARADNRDPGPWGGGGPAGSGARRSTPAAPGRELQRYPPTQRFRRPQLRARPRSDVSLPTAPPAVSGGTLLVLSDGLTAVAADPDRDQVYLVDLAGRTLTATVPLTVGDEPGRVVQDGNGLVHVALRRGGAVVTIDPSTAEIRDRRWVCAAPRGIAHDPAMDMLHVACAGGELVSLAAAGGPVVRTRMLASDLRDVVVSGDRLQVTTFRSAEILTVDATGSVTRRLALPSFRSPDVRGGQAFSPGVAWRTIGMSDGSVAMVHQRAVDDVVLQNVERGYGGRSTCDSIIHTSVSVVAADGTVRNGPALGDFPLAVDLALSPDGTKVAFVSAANGNGTPIQQAVHVTDVTSVVDAHGKCRHDISRSSCSGSGCGALRVSSVRTGVVAIAFVPDGSVVVQTREPAMLHFSTYSATAGLTVTLSSESRRDTGHTVFHANAGASIACASCHAEGRDDGRVWNFSCQGARRTQSMQVGLRGTEPFHWAGDEKDFPQLVHDVFTMRMAGPELEPTRPTRRCRGSTPSRGWGGPRRSTWRRRSEGGRYFRAPPAPPATAAPG